MLNPYPYVVFFFQIGIKNKAFGVTHQPSHFDNCVSPKLFFAFCPVSQIQIFSLCAAFSPLASRN
jgi:hypothetical protein